ncbi:hypothetical protein CEXT_210631 [Caerostris extrusa]|uniref:Uncharacterized protein n=1 Tax=Caerostris extrusa TaxID=172846 RepID=A0AAV4XJA5_CAEEX|nr:hypothetical protein CEXT_210631 [Caerostris extrusa]
MPSLTYRMQRLMDASPTTLSLKERLKSGNHKGEIRAGINSPRLLLLLFVGAVLCSPQKECFLEVYQSLFVDVRLWRYSNAVHLNCDALQRHST